MPSAIDLTAKVFGRLTAVRLLRTGGVSRGSRRWLCVCACGNEHEVSAGNLRGGEVKSCGCLRRDANVAKGPSFKKHGMRNSREYRTWRAMRSRCENPNVPPYKNYGGRGIAVCARWLAFENFLLDMGRHPIGMDLDRIDNNGNYEPGNCRWVTRSENVSNSRARRTNAKGQFTSEVLSVTWNSLRNSGGVAFVAASVDEAAARMKEFV